MLTELRKMCPDCFGMNYKGECCPDCEYEHKIIRGEERALSSGTLLGSRYLIGRIIGIGGFGITYKAYDTLYSGICAIKEYAPSDITYRMAGSATIQMNGAATQFEHGMKRFMEEAQMLKQLEGVPEVVRVMECFKENHTAYFVMEYLDGTNLKKLIRTAGRSIDSKEITSLIISIGSAMDVIHRTTNILHRDISPENIYILRDGTAKLLDFGSARQTMQGREQGFSVELKPGFAPLEQYSQSGRQGSYTDVYALACTYYYALTGIMMPTAFERLEGQEYEPLYTYRPEISRVICKGLDKALELDYRNRIQTMKAFVDVLSEGKAPVREPGKNRIRKQVPYLEVLTGRSAGNRWQLPVNTEISLGRSPALSNIILTSDPSISNVHCIIVYEEASNRFLLKDLSRNGTFVKNKRLDKNIYLKYDPGLQFSMASQECLIRAGVSYE